MVKSVVAFLVLLNPFAMFIYLQPVMRELSPYVFMRLLARASLISFIIFAFFSYAGEYIFKDIFQIRFESFRIFGGAVFFTYAFMYIVHGRRSLIELKENLHDVANEIALPFMVGAGTISLAILMGYKYAPTVSLTLLLITLLINFSVVVLLMFLRKVFRPKWRVAFDKVMEMSMRLIGFFVGAIGVDMMITGIRNVFFE